jgi:hypothetical protein
MLPFFMALGGIVSDFISTTVGLGLGLCETNPQYNPVWALIIYWGVIMILYLTCYQRKSWLLGANVVALTSYLGVINNTLAIMGVLPGIK